MKTVYVFGNEHLAEDNLALQVGGLLENVALKHCTSPEDIMDAADELVVLDVVKGISEPILVTDIAQLETRPMVSLHDFDLGFFLKLMQELGMERHIKVLGIPQEGDAEEFAKKVSVWI